MTGLQEQQPHDTAYLANDVQCRPGPGSAAQSRSYLQHEQHKLSHAAGCCDMQQGQHELLQSTEQQGNVKSARLMQPSEPALVPQQPTLGCAPLQQHRLDCTSEQPPRLSPVEAARLAYLEEQKRVHKVIPSESLPCVRSIDNCSLLDCANPTGCKPHVVSLYMVCKPANRDHSVYSYTVLNAFFPQQGPTTPAVLTLLLCHDCRRPGKLCSEHLESMDGCCRNKGVQSCMVD